MSKLPLQRKHKEYEPTDKTKSVVVRKKNTTDRPIDLRSEAMLWEHGHAVSGASYNSPHLTCSSSANTEHRAKRNEMKKKKTHKNKKATIIQARCQMPSALSSIPGAAFA